MTGKERILTVPTAVAQAEPAAAQAGAKRVAEMPDPAEAALTAVVRGMEAAALAVIRARDWEVPRGRQAVNERHLLTSIHIATRRIGTLFRIKAS